MMMMIFENAADAHDALVALAGAVCVLGSAADAHDAGLVVGRFPLCLRKGG